MAYPETPSEVPPHMADTHAEIAALRAKIETLMNDRVTPAVARAADRAEAVAHQATDTIRDQTERLSGAIREKPLTAVGLAALAGYVFAVMCRR
ncbi:hypothetical protein EJV46_21470 [Roseococcus sp. SYP-B2431]|uniref:hypothetical protein n=1 Tax=Roseococcus sp. SYP-B2431 TaxID=2496640 RepID=UPI0010DA6198|nr:hypothetical protein [Roseococcus sp. SYP-B2431]TCH96153.1 hypothetical protein EJV46_21470 [Roseococcus sp. SYP-B2431]